jgi:hypothetical protein
MSDDPIVDEIHEIRQQMLAEYGGDLDALLRDAQKRTEEAARAGRKVVSLPPRPPRSALADPKKAG